MAAMTEDSVSNERKEALIKLLDDPSPLVKEALLAEFQRLGRSGRLILEKIPADASEEQKRWAATILEKIYGPDPSSMLLNFIQSLEYELETGLILINRVVFPELEMTLMREHLDSLAARCRELQVLPLKPLDQCQVINRVLFHEVGFRGIPKNAEDPANSCLGSVLERKKGLSIVLTSIYILVAQRLGLDLEPIALPGHFMAGCFKTDWPIYMDPLQGGRMRSLEDMHDLLVSSNTEPKMHHLAPAPVGEVLYRMCLELADNFSFRQERSQAEKFQTFIRAFEETHQQRSEA